MGRTIKNLFRNLSKGGFYILMEKMFKYKGRKKEYQKEYHQINKDKLNKQERVRYRKRNPIKIGQGNGKGSKKTQFTKGDNWEGRFGHEKAKKMKVDKGKLFKKINTGKRASKETREKMSNSWDYNKHFTKEIKKKMGESRKGENNPNYGNGEKIKGEKNPAWLGGISFEPYGIQFTKKLKEQIRERDNHICQECGNPQSELKRLLSVHHIDYNKKNNNHLNLISLCIKCHIKTNSNRKHWKRYFKNIMALREIFNPENILIFDERTKGLIGLERIK